ncbi:hypothetical protein C2E23DRAFT_808256 [Lenzites betulinus]|nr:hypothetical protein C2E23DRAFT_808256 [Lenzites betulinus]
MRPFAGRPRARHACWGALCLYGGDDDHGRAEHTERATGRHLGSELMSTHRHQDAGPESHTAIGGWLGDQAVCVLSPVMRLLANMRRAKRYRRCKRVEILSGNV